jgi:hypothetical protein
MDCLLHLCNMPAHSYILYTVAYCEYLHITLPSVRNYVSITNPILPQQIRSSGKKMAGLGLSDVNIPCEAFRMRLSGVNIPCEGFRMHLSGVNVPCEDLRMHLSGVIAPCEDLRTRPASLFAAYARRPFRIYILKLNYYIN